MINVNRKLAAAAAANGLISRCVGSRDVRPRAAGPRRVDGLVHSLCRGNCVIGKDRTKGVLVGVELFDPRQLRPSRLDR